MNAYLFDENLPARITFTPRLPVIHCSSLGTSLSDTHLWEHTRQNSCVIVSKDADFSNRIILSSPPPWFVHLRIGNMRKRDFHALLARVWPDIEQLLPAHKLINVYQDRIEAVS